MKIEKIHGQVIALTKEIYFNPPHKEIGIVSKFIAPDGDLPFPLFGTPLKWWYSKRALKLCDDIAKMSIQFDNNLKYADKKDLSGTIQETLKKNATNRELFQIFSNDPDSLFDSRTQRDVEQYSKKLWETLHTSMLQSLTKWLIMYPMPGILSRSCNLRYDGLHIVRSADRQYWDQFKPTYPAFTYLDFVVFKTAEGNNILNIDPPKTWLGCEMTGTENKAKFYASLFMRKFIAVLFSFLRETNHNATSKSARNVNSYSVQLPSASSNIGVTSIFSSIGTLIHPILGEIELKDSILDEVTRWYAHSQKLDEEEYRRVSKASHFLNYALLMDNIHRFLYFFIVLDALFGVRKRVEASIKAGISKHFTEPQWQNKIERLFDLRSDLVHGGSSFIQECIGYDSYVNHFDSDPEEDVEIAATKCLREYVF